MLVVMEGIGVLFTKLDDVTGIGRCAWLKVRVEANFYQCLIENKTNNQDKRRKWKIPTKKITVTSQDGGF